MSLRSRAGPSATVGFVLLALLGPLMVIGSRLLLDPALTGDDEITEKFFIFSRVHTWTYVAAWILVLTGLFRIYRRGPKPMLRMTLALWSASLAIHIIAIAVASLVQLPELMDLPDLLSTGSLILSGLGLAAALLFHHRQGAPRDRVITVSALAAAVYGMALIPGELVLQGGELLLIIAVSLDAILYLSLIALPWSAGADDTLPRSASPEARRHFVAGGVAIAVGLLLTIGSYAIGGIDGRALLAWGPIVYGAVRVFQGLTAERS